MSVNHKRVSDHKSLGSVVVKYDCGVIALDVGDKIKLNRTVIRVYEMKRWGHDEICYYLYGSENKQTLQSIQGFLPDSTGQSTPDFVLVDSSNKIVIHELKTSLNRSSGAYVAATRQYLHVLRSANREYEYSCLGVSPESVTWDCSIELSAQDLEFMTFVMQISRKIQDYLLDTGIVLDDYILSSAPLKVPSVDLRKEGELFIDDDLIDYWKNLNADSVSGSMLMLEAAKQVPDITAVRDQDERTFKNLYNDGIVSNEMPFKVGLMIPTISSELIPEPTAQMSNRKLQSLWTSYRQKVAKDKCNSCRVTLSDSRLDGIGPDDEDVKKGLWAGLIRGKRTGLFREAQIMKNKQTQEPVSSIDRHSLSIKDHISKRYAPIDIDLNQVSSILCSRIGNPLPEPKQTLIDQKQVEIPYQNEYWFQATRFWQRLVEEINVGRYSSQGKWNSFHCHQICPYNAWLFVHGTGLHSHQFYYLVFHTTSPVCWPNNVYEFSPGWWCTTCIKSLRSDKINQHLNILERLVSLRYYWSSVLGSGARSDKHFSASLLIAYDSKQQTIDTLSLYRYIYMEFCKSAETRNPSKIVTKLPHDIRSPVLAWIISRMRKLVLHSSQLQPKLKKTKQNTSRMNFKGLVSWVDFEPIKDFNTILSLSYMHYATSHPVSIGLHGKIQIMGKLLKEERKLGSIGEDYRLGTNRPCDLGPHEYSASFVKKMAQNSCQRLLYVYPTFESFIRVYSNRLLKWKLSDFATFKKSTMVTDPDPSKRAYCFEEVLRLTDKLTLNPLNASNYSPYIELSKFIQYQEEEPKNRNVSIFVKDQQTGLREIFVLPINLRILIKSMEIFARVVNETLPNETLSYPKRKDLVVTEHIRKAQVQMLALKKTVKNTNERVIMLRYSSSSDAKAWCQQFCMPVFGCFITTLLYEAYGQESMGLIRYFCFILNQITGKHIHVDARVKDWLRMAKDVETSSDYLRDLMEMYQGKRVGLYEDGSIINMSNMMQGIPHETSSSLHASYLIFMTMVLKSLVLEQCSKRVRSIKLGTPVIDSLVSSDDSGILFSLPVLIEEENGHMKKSHEIELNELKKLLYKLGYSIEFNKRLFSAEASIEKSTIFAESPVFEFNSRFYIGRSIATAEIKFAVSSLTMGFHTNIVDRIDEALSSLKGCVKEGIRQDQLMVIQQCLRRMHIRFLYSDWWDESLASRIDKSQSPRLGVLPMVRQGMIGFMNLNMISDYALLLKSPSYWPMRRSVQHLIEGTDSYSLTLKVGRKYMQVLRSLNISKESLEAELKKLSIDPIRFLKRELPELMLIKIKLLNPGARIALSYVDLAKIHMASCYASTTQCITHDQKGKVSLLDCLEIEETLHSEEFLQPVTQCFTEIEYIEEVLNNGYQDQIEKDQTKISTEIVFKNERRDIYSMLIKCWETGFSSSEREVLQSIQNLVPEVKDNLKDTMLGFKSIFSLEAHLRSLDQKPFAVNVLSFTSGSKNFLHSYQTYLRSNWSRRYSLVICGSEIHRIREELITSSCLKRWKNDLLDRLSALSGSIKFPPIDRDLISMIQGQVVDNDLTVEQIDHDLSNILVFLSSKNRKQRMDLKNFKSSDRRILGFKPNEIYIFDRGCWYILIKRESEWVLLKEEQAPRLPYIECKYEVRDNLPIWVEPSELRVKIDKSEGLTVHSNYWNSDCFKELRSKFPHLRTDNAWVEIKPGPFVHEEYLELLPLKYKTDICKRLLSAAHLDMDRSCQKFDFWVFLSDIIAEGNFTKEEKSLARCLMTIATEEEEQVDEEYDPFQEVVYEEVDQEEKAEMSRILIEEMLGWAGEEDSEDETADFGVLSLAQDFGDWCMNDLIESYQERGKKPKNSLFRFHWKYRIRVGYLNSFRLYIKENEHNPIRSGKIEAARGKLVFLNPERFGEKLPD